jgi:anti-sigma factor RsiW
MSPNEHLGEALFALAADDPELAPADRAALEAHAAGCPDCAAALAEARQVWAALDAPALEPSAGFDRALFAELDAIDREAAGPGWWARLAEWLSPPRLALGGALAVAAIGAVVVLGPRVRDEAPPELELARQLETLEVAEDLDLLIDLELAENLDVLEDLDVIEGLEEAG